MIAAVLARSLKAVAITFSGVAIGGAGFLVLIHVRDMLRGRIEAIAFAMARVGFIIIVGLLAKLVERLPDLPPSGDVWWYLAGLVLAGSGYLLLAIRAFVRSRKHLPADAE